MGFTPPRLTLNNKSIIIQIYILILKSNSIPNITTNWNNRKIISRQDLKLSKTLTNGGPLTKTDIYFQ